jgi:hypothetical protein
VDGSELHRIYFARDGKKFRRILVPGGTAEIRLRLQMTHDLAKIRDEADSIRVKPYGKTASRHGESR